jgi:hypothetical protein
MLLPVRVASRRPKLGKVRSAIAARLAQPDVSARHVGDDLARIHRSRASAAVPDHIDGTHAEQPQTEAAAP